MPEGKTLTNAHGHFAQSINLTTVETVLAFQCPGLVSIVQERLAIICNGLAFRIDRDGRVVVLHRSRPFRRHVHLLRIPYSDEAIVL